MPFTQLRQDAASEVVKAAPAVAATAAVKVLGLTLNEWVAAITILYILLQMLWLIFRWWHVVRRGVHRGVRASRRWTD